MSEDINRLFELGGQSYQLIKQIGLINEEFGQAKVETNPADVLYTVMEWFVSECYKTTSRSILQSEMSDMVREALNHSYGQVPKHLLNEQIMDNPLTLIRMVNCEGQSTCRRCYKAGKWNRCWTSMMYRLTTPDGKCEYPGHYCADCAKELRKITYREFEKMREDSKI